MWPFSKKNRGNDSAPLSASRDSGETKETQISAQDNAVEAAGQPGSQGGHAEGAVRNAASTGAESAAAAAGAATAASGSSAPAAGSVPSDAVAAGAAVAEGVDNVLTSLPEPQLFDGMSGERGPFDSRRGDIDSIDVAKLAAGVLNLESMQLGLPEGAEVQVEVNQQTHAPQAVHIVTQAGRITPAIFAAPRSGGLWEEQIRELAPQLAGDGFTVSIEKGPWGTELVGRNGDGHVRLVGVNGRGWMVRFFAVGPEAREEELIDVVRGIVSRTIVHRGSAPMPAGQPMQVSLPRDMAEALQNAIQQQAQQQAQATAAGRAPGPGAQVPASSSGKGSTSAAAVANAFAKRNPAPRHGNGQTASLRTTSALDELDGLNNAA